jgi:hypothetical protein
VNVAGSKLKRSVMHSLMRSRRRRSMALWDSRRFWRLASMDEERGEGVG